MIQVLKVTTSADNTMNKHAFQHNSLGVDFPARDRFNEKSLQVFKKDYRQEKHLFQDWVFVRVAICCFLDTYFTEKLSLIKRSGEVNSLEGYEPCSESIAD